MERAVLIVGVGNVLQGDDGFGVELIRRLQTEAWPEGVALADFGIRTVHLAYELLEPPGLLIIADAVHRRGAPGTLYLIEPDFAAAPSEDPGGHGVGLPGVFALLDRLGGKRPRVLLVGCEPQSLEEGLELSPAVRGGLEGAAALVREVVARELRTHVPGGSPEAMP